MELEDQSSINAISKKLWTSLNMLRGEISSDHYYGVLLLMLLHKDGYFNNRNSLFESSMIEFIEAEVAVVKNDGTGWYKDIFIDFVDDLREISQERFKSIIQSLDSLDYIALNTDFPKLFDNILFTLMQSKRYVGEFALPREIIRLVCNLVELPTHANVFNPFAGIGSFGIEMNRENNYVGQEIIFRTWLIGYLRLKAYGIKDSMYMPGDSVDEWNIAISELDSEKDKFDLVISCPPFALRLQQPVIGKFGSIRRVDHFVIEKGLEDLNESGKLVIVVSQSFLIQSGVERNFKEYLVENGLLQMVIYLPGGLLMHTGIPVLIIVINKERLTPESVRFVDGKDFVKNISFREKILKVDALLSYIKSSEESDFVKDVSFETIRENDFNLSVPRYFAKNYTGEPLSKILTLIRGERIENGEMGKFVRTNTLKDDPLDYFLEINSIENTDIPRNARKIEESCLLVSSRSKTLKPTFFNFNGTPIYISPELFAFKVDDVEAEISYLINELHADYILKQIETYRIGCIISNIRRDDLLLIQISLPDLMEQKESIKLRLLARAEEKKRELSLFNRIHGLEKEIYEQNTYLRHTLAGPSSNLKDSVANLKKILLEQVLPAYPGLLDTKISQQHLLTFGEYLNIIERDASKIVSGVSSQLKVGNEMDNKKLTQIEIVSFLENYINEYKSRLDLNFQLFFELDENVVNNDNGERPDMYIMANESLLYDLFNNLIENAVKHAFYGQEDNQIEIMFTLDSESNSVKIKLSNTGNPFPKNFGLNDFIRKGSKSGQKAGDGFGGWYVNEIVKKFNGKLNIYNLSGDDEFSISFFVTSIEINIPIYEILGNE